MSLVDELDPEGSIRTGDSTAEFMPIKIQSTFGDSTTWLSDWRGEFPADFELPAMQHPLQRARYLNRRLVAIKSPALLREAAILRALGPHKHIQRLYDAFLESRTGAVHLVLEPLEGNAYQLIKSRRRRAFAPGLLVDMAHQLAEGVAFVHSQGFVHRNLTTENVLVTTLGLARWTVTLELRDLVADLVPRHDSPSDIVAQFKLSGLERGCRIEEVYGRELLEDGNNLLYSRSPELLRLDLGEGPPSDLGPSIDTWALGLILVELTALNPPFCCKGTPQTQLDEILETLGTSHVNTVNHIAALANVARYSSDPPMAWIECLANLLRYDPRLRSTAEDILRLPLLTSRYSMEPLALESPPQGLT